MANDNIYRRHHDPIIIITSTEMKRYERLDILHDGPDAICIVWSLPFSWVDWTLSAAVKQIVPLFLKSAGKRPINN